MESQSDRSDVLAGLVRTELENAAARRIAAVEVVVSVVRGRMQQRVGGGGRSSDRYGCGSAGCRR